MNFDHLNHYTITDARTQVEALRRRLHAHAHAYYNLGQPTITDAEYDAMRVVCFNKSLAWFD
jgi:NAD-dependent DNA ligase